jgi:two-component system, OmpR family, response regulator
MSVQYSDSFAAEIPRLQRHRPESRIAAMKILIIEDDRETAAFLSERLLKHGHRVEVCNDAETGSKRAREHGFDALIVDRMLPGLDGLTAVQRLRHAGLRTPILMLTALNEVSSRAEGLFAGADDYLCKPFAIEELLARLHALARRSENAGTYSTVLTTSDLSIDRTSRQVTRAGKRIDLLAKEYEVLEFLAVRPGQIVTRTMLLQSIWNINFDPGTNIVESQISRLRAKLEADGATRLIHTTRGQGYVFRED